MVSKTASKGAASSTEGSAKTKMQTIHFITYQTESVSLKGVLLLLKNMNRTHGTTKNNRLNLCIFFCIVLLPTLFFWDYRWPNLESFQGEKKTHIGVSSVSRRGSFLWQTHLEVMLIRSKCEPENVTKLMSMCFLYTQVANCVFCCRRENVLACNNSRCRE